MGMMGAGGLNFNNMTFRVDGDDSDANGLYDGNSDGGDDDGCQVQHGGGCKYKIQIQNTNTKYNTRYNMGADANTKYKYKYKYKVQYQVQHGGGCKYKYKYKIQIQIQSTIPGTIWRRMERESQNLCTGLVLQLSESSDNMMFSFLRIHMVFMVFRFLGGSQIYGSYMDHDDLI